MINQTINTEHSSTASMAQSPTRARLARRNTLIAAFMLAGASGMTTSLSHASWVECSSSEPTGVCTVNLVDGVSLRTNVASLTEEYPGDYTINGLVEIVAAGLTVPLVDAELNVRIGEKPEMYGHIGLPLDKMPLLKHLGLNKTPRASIGFVNVKNIHDFLDTKPDELPLNNGISEVGTQRNSNNPYFVFKFENTLEFDLSGEKMVSAIAGTSKDPSDDNNNDESGDSSIVSDALTELLSFSGSAKFKPPGSFSSMGILDMQDPYFYLTYDSGGADLDSMVQSTVQSLNANLKTYNAKDSDGKVAVVYEVNEDGGTVKETNYITKKTVYYTLTESGNYNQKNRGKDGYSIRGDFFNRAKNGTQKGKKTKTKYGELIDSVGFSANGWIPFKAPLPGATDDVFDVSGQIYLKGSIPLPYKLGNLSGKGVLFVSEYGYGLGAKGDWNMTIPYVSDLIGLSMKVGDGTIGYEVATNDDYSKVSGQMFVDGKLDPNDEILDYIIPIRGQGDATLTGYIGENIENTHLNLKGNWNVGFQKLGDIIGVDLPKFAEMHGEFKIDKEGLFFNGYTSNQIIPGLTTRNTMEANLNIDWNSPEEFDMWLMGDIELAGFPLASALIQITYDGVFINGSLVTPVSTFDMAGSITSSGLYLSGSGMVNIDLADISRSIDAAEQKVAAAQAEVNRLESNLNTMRAQVRSERDHANRELAAAQYKVRNAQAEVQSLQNQINAEQSAIKRRHAEIASWKDWSNSGAWWENRWARYAYEAGWRSTEIAAREITKGSLIAAKSVANEALNAAVYSVDTLSRALDHSPIDLDFRVAAIITAKESAYYALEVVRAPLANLPQLNGSIYAETYMALDYQGLHGSVWANIGGQQFNGEIRSNPQLQACVIVGEFGEACSSL